MSRIVVVLVALAVVMLPQPASAAVAAAGTGSGTVNPGFGQPSVFSASASMTGRWDNLTGAQTCSFSATDVPVVAGDSKAGIGVATANCNTVKKVVCSFLWTRVSDVATLEGPRELGLGCTVGTSPTLRSATGTIVLINTQRSILGAAVPYDVVVNLVIADPPATNN
jgi:hypothetical protein